MCKKIGEMMKKSILFAILFWATIAVFMLALLFQLTYQITNQIWYFDGNALTIFYIIFVSLGTYFLSGLSTLGIITLCGSKLLLSNEITDEVPEGEKTLDFNERVIRLKQLNNLRESGAITDAEFEEQKRKILG